MMLNRVENVRRIIKMPPDEANRSQRFEVIRFALLPGHQQCALEAAEVSDFRQLRHCVEDQIETVKTLRGAAWPLSNEYDDIIQALEWLRRVCISRYERTSISG